MNIPHTLAALLIATFFAASRAWAGEGHDHGTAAPATAGQALPRFAAESETFELVGVLSGKQMTLYLDRFNDNSPVRDAKIELEIGGKNFRAAKLDDDSYEVVLADAPKPGLLPITVAVTAGNETDLLAADLDIGDTAPIVGTVHASSWKRYAAWAVAGVAAFGLVAWAGRRLVDTRRARAGGAA